MRTSGGSGTVTEHADAACNAGVLKKHDVDRSSQSEGEALQAKHQGGAVQAVTGRRQLSEGVQNEVRLDSRVMSVKHRRSHRIACDAALRLRVPPCRARDVSRKRSQQP